MHDATHHASRAAALRDLSPSAQRAAAFFRSLARALKSCRLYRRENPVVAQMRDQLHAQLNEDLAACGTWQFRFTPFEIFLVDEPVVRSSQLTADPDAPPAPEEKLPFLFYRDGIRTLALMPDVPAHEFQALFDALLAVGVNGQTHDDLVTLLWQANTNKLRIESVPFSQTIYLHSHAPEPGSGTGSHQGQSFAWSPSGSEIRADIGQLEGGPAGLHKDTFDDWPLPESWVDVPQAYAKLDRSMQFTRTRLLTEWAAERGIDWQMDAEVLLEKIARLDPAPQTRLVLARSVVTWLGAAIQDSRWEDAHEAFTLLRRFDPDGALTNEELRSTLLALDTGDITERLDESQTDDQGRFFALTVAIGAPAVPLACDVMAKAQKSRTRAAACTMLCYLCSDEPELLAGCLTDERWYVCRNAVFILGQIGGEEVLPLLELASHHHEIRVRRAVVQALGNCPGPQRVPLLLEQLGTNDPQLLSAALHMLARFQSPVIARAILRAIEHPAFEQRPREIQRSLFAALGEIGDDEVVPHLSTMVQKGGWLARPTFERSAAARCLQRIATPAALAALEAGVRSRSEAVRHACLEAMNARGM